MKRIIGIALILIGVAIIGQFVYKQWYAAPKALQKVNETLKEVDAEQMKKNKEAYESEEDLFDFSDVRHLKIEEVNGKVDPSRIIGAIALPTVDVHLPILIGATHQNMLSGAGTMKKDQEMGQGNYALAGHNALNPTILFAPIRHVEKGDPMYITDKEYIYEYEMIHSEVVMPERVDVINDREGQTLLTLVSCYSADGSDRIIVTGSFVQKVPLEEAEEEVVKWFMSE